MCFNVIMKYLHFHCIVLLGFTVSDYNFENLRTFNIYNI